MPCSERSGEPSSFTCPKCGSTSFNRNDVDQSYCACCHTFARDLALFLVSMMKPSEEELAERLGYVYVRKVEDTYIGVRMLLQFQADLMLFRQTGSLDGADNFWRYEQLATAIVAAANWDPARTLEPFGWYRHPRTSRRRAFGNPAAEYFLP